MTSGLCLLPLNRALKKGMKASVVLNDLLNSEKQEKNILKNRKYYLMNLKTELFFFQVNAIHFYTKVSDPK